jgi:hypothetical protein
MRQGAGYHEAGSIVSQLTQDNSHFIGPDDAFSDSLLGNNGTFTTIDAPGVLSNTAASGINDRGQIVGFNESASGPQ